MVEIQGPDDDSPPGRSLAPPPSPEDQTRLDLDGKVTSLAYALDAIRRQTDATTERTARIEGVLSALLGALESLRGDQHDLTTRTEQRVLRGLEILDSRLAQSRDRGRLPEDQGDEAARSISHLSDKLLSAVENLKSESASSAARLQDRVSGLVEAALAQMHESSTTLLHGQSLAAEESVRKVEAALAAAAESEETTARSTAAFQLSLTQALRHLEDKLDSVEQTVLEHLEGAGRSAAQSAERSDKTLDQLIAALERMDSRISHQVSSSEYALHGTLADLERKITEQVSEAVQSIEARVRQREEALVRLIVAGGLEGPDYQ